MLPSNIVIVKDHGQSYDQNTRVIDLPELMTLPYQVNVSLITALGEHQLVLFQPRVVSLNQLSPAYCHISLPRRQSGGFTNV